MCTGPTLPRQMAWCALIGNIAHHCWYVAQLQTVSVCSGSTIHIHKLDLIIVCTIITSRHSNTPTHALALSVQDRLATDPGHTQCMYVREYPLDPGQFQP